MTELVKTLGIFFSHYSFIFVAGDIPLGEDRMKLDVVAGIQRLK